MDPVHVGFGGIVAANRILAILDPNSQPVRRMVRKAKKEGMAIDIDEGWRKIISRQSHISGNFLTQASNLKI